MSKETNAAFLLRELHSLYCLAVGISNFLELIHTEMAEKQPEQETDHSHFIGMVRLKADELQERLEDVVFRVAGGTHE